MNVFYDSQSATLALHNIIEERKECPYSGLQVQTLLKDPELTFKVTFDGVVGRLTYAKEDTEPEEVVAAFQGILMKKDLPPIGAPYVTKRQIQYSRQSVTLTGLGLESFNATATSVALIHDLIKRQVGDRVQDGNIVDMEDDYPCLEALNRFMTPRAEVKNTSDICGFGEEVDPFGHLKKAAGEEYVHTADNTVLYFERVQNQATKDNKFKAVSPASFSRGDIIEVQVSFVVLPAREKAQKISMILRSITLLDPSFTQDSILRSFEKKLVKGKAKPGLKRKVGYTHEEMSVARAKMGRMDIDDKNERADKDGEAEGAGAKS